jgi:integrase
VVPAEVAMNGEANRVPLSAQVRRILDELRPETGDGDFVIASPYKRGAHLRSLKTANTSIRLRRKMRTWTPHDLRRTAASKMRSLGVDRRAPTILKDSSKATMPSHPGSMHGPLTCDCMETTSPSMLN